MSVDELKAFRVEYHDTILAELKSDESDFTKAEYVLYYLTGAVL
jgi:hypothetical protein